MKKNKWVWIASIWASLIFIASVVPSTDLPSISIWEPDKVAHCIVYAFLVFSVVNALARQIKNTRFRLHPKIIGVSSCILYGIGIEFIQRLLPTRSFDYYDMLANFAGCTTGLLLVSLYLRRNPA